MQSRETHKTQKPWLQAQQASSLSYKSSENWWGEILSNSADYKLGRELRGCSSCESYPGHSCRESQQTHWLTTQSWVESFLWAVVGAQSRVNRSLFMSPQEELQNINQEVISSHLWQPTCSCFQSINLRIPEHTTHIYQPLCYVVIWRPLGEAIQQGALACKFWIQKSWVPIFCWLVRSLGQVIVCTDFDVPGLESFLPHKNIWIKLYEVI